MIIPLLALILGAGLGAWRAKKRGGSRADLIHWGIVNGLIWGLVGFFVLVFLSRASM